MSKNWISSLGDGGKCFYRDSQCEAEGQLILAENSLFVVKHIRIYGNTSGKDCLHNLLYVTTLEFRNCRIYVNNRLSEVNYLNLLEYEKLVEIDKGEGNAFALISVSKPKIIEKNIKKSKWWNFFKNI